MSIASKTRKPARQQLKNHRLQVLISGELDSRLGKAARRVQLSKGEWVRRAIESALRESVRTLPAESDPLVALGDLCAPTADIEDMLGEIEAGRV